MNKYLKEGYLKADTTNLPSVNPFMIYEFLITDDRFNAPEVRGEKLTLSTRESYGDSAIGYVSLKRVNNQCIVEAMITPEHRVRGRYFTSVTIDEEENTIKDVSCSDCPASEGGCKHVIAFLMWLHRRSEDLSPTEKVCYWKKSKLSNVGTTLKFIKVLDLLKKDESPAPKLPENSSFLKDIMNLAKEKGLDSQLSRYHFNPKNRDPYALSVHKIIIDFFDQKEIQSKDSASFLNFMKTLITQDLCLLAEKLTKDQSNCLLWFELRYGRITASKFYEAAHCKTKNGTLVNQILGMSKKYDNLLMERGRNLEEKVLKVVQKKQNKIIHKSGFIVIEKVPFFGASPDGIIQGFPVEVKCPGSFKTYENYISNGKLKDKYKAQIMLQMYAMNQKKGLFCIADPEFEKNKTVEMLWVDWDEKFFFPLLFSASLFWKDCIFEKLLESMK